MPTQWLPLAKVTLVVPLLTFPLLQDELDCIDTDDHTVAMIGINSGIVRVCFGYSDW